MFFLTAEFEILLHNNENTATQMISLKSPEINCVLHI